MNNISKHTFRNNEIKALSQKHGFELCGATNVVKISEQKKYIDNWIDRGFHGTMEWFSRNEELRFDPSILFDGAETMIICAKYYNPEVDFADNPKIAKYALGDDYHHTIKMRLEAILGDMGVEGRCFVDSAPVLERFWAQRCGIGWIGRNGLVTNQHYGSRLLIGGILIGNELDWYDKPTNNRCGQCGLCIESCPTGVLVKSEFDCRECLSYLTIEHKGAFLPQQERLVAQCNPEHTIYGCDCCVDSCPWSKRAERLYGYTHHCDDRFIMTAEQWQIMSNGDFKRAFRTTPLFRCGIKRLKQTLLCIAKK